MNRKVEKLREELDLLASKIKALEVEMRAPKSENTPAPSEAPATPEAPASPESSESPASPEA